MSDGRRIPRHVAAALALLAVTALTLAALGRPWWCRAGDLGVWSGQVQSRHNSQHLLDPYTFTHVLHGLLFYFGVWLGFRRVVGRIGRGWIAFLLECGWEVVENTDAVIERYRAATISLDYYGDSVANSLADIVAFAVGYGAAAVSPVWLSVAGFVLVDGALALWIRDGLVLNILMLLYPVESIRQWQARPGG